MAVMRRGIPSLKAPRERIVSCNVMYTRLSFHRHFTSTPSPEPPSSEKCVAAQPVLQVSDHSPATEIKAERYQMCSCLAESTTTAFVTSATTCKTGLRLCKYIALIQSKAAEPYMEVCWLERGEDVLRRVLFLEGPGVNHQGCAGNSFISL